MLLALLPVARNRLNYLLNKLVRPSVQTNICYSTLWFCKKPKKYKTIRLPFKEVMSYIVVHELAHLIHPNHSPEFWNTVDKMLINYDNHIK